jgi:hypothetical protein
MIPIAWSRRCSFIWTEIFHDASLHHLAFAWVNSALLLLDCPFRTPTAVLSRLPLASMDGNGTHRAIQHGSH